MNSILIKLFVGVILALILYGVVGGVDLVFLIAALILLRLWTLIKQWFSRPASQSDWNTLRQELWAQLEELSVEDLAQLKSEYTLTEDASNQELVEASLERSMRAYQPPRAKAELLCDLVGLLSYLLLCPFVIALFGLNFVALNLPLTWTAFILILVSLTAYFVPYYLWPSAEKIRSRCLWWCLPFFPLMILSLYGVEIRHPYLNPLQPERNRIAAERVLAMDNIISAGRHVEVVKRYGQSLEQMGQLKEALLIYEFALRLNASDFELRSDMDRIAQQLGGRDSEAKHLSYKRKSKSFTSAIRTMAIGPEFNEFDGFTVVIVSVGAVPERVKVKVAEAIRRELSVDAVIAAGELPLPKHTRRRGLVTGKQWSAEAIVAAFGSAFPTLPSGPVKYLILTPADIYMPQANFIFSGSMPWGAIVSFSRYEGPGNLLEERTAKQALCALIKVFPIKPSTSRDCVTSYSRSVAEFDQKGNSPNAEILSEFRYHVDLFDQGWRDYQAIRGK